MDSQNQAADQVSVSHSIGSLRFLSAMDWKEFVETLSVVDRPCGRIPPTFTATWIFRPGIDTAMRSRPSRGTASSPEAEVARKAIQLAEEGAGQNGHDDRTAHVGYYLIDKGRPALEQRGESALALANRASSAASTAFRWHSMPAGSGCSRLLATFGFVRLARGARKSTDGDCWSSRWCSCYAPASWRWR